MNLIFYFDKNMSHEPYDYYNKCPKHYHFRSQCFILVVERHSSIKVLSMNVAEQLIFNIDFGNGSTSQDEVRDNYNNYERFTVYNGSVSAI